MQARISLSVLLALLSSPTLAASDPAGCNQLGREVALRAAEQLPGAGLDAATRAELALIAETVCLDYTQPPATPSAAPAAAPAATPDAAAGAEGQQDRRNVFGLEIIPPEERVRRPGLKRP